MVVTNVFSDADRVEISVNLLYELLKEAALADIFRNAVKNKVPYEYILQVIDGNADSLAHDELIWHDAKTDPPKEPGVYYGKIDDTDRMWLCYFSDGEWVLDAYRDQKMDIIQWAEYTAVKSED